MSLASTLPWTTSPFVANAPMGGYAGPKLAAAVSRAGGLGLIGALMDPTELDQQLSEASQLLSASPPVTKGKNDSLPLGVGLILFGLASKEKRETFLGVLAKWKPAVVWLFAENELEDFAVWTEHIRGEIPAAQVWIQVCSVGTAVKLAKQVKPDVLVMQGQDAGGHGWIKRAGVISLVPETKDALASEGLDKVRVVTSGGIVDARGIAAALSLGAEGVIMGTRFLASEEVTVPHSGYQRQVIEARDGGQTTVKHTLFDELKGPNMWPKQYDGRAIRGSSWTDYEHGLSVEQIREKHAKASAGEDLGFGADNRAAVWAGSGVGLVNEVLPAAEILKQVRGEVKARLEEAKARL